MEHAGHSHSNVSGKNVLITILLNVVITVAQFIGGFISGSMALMSDAAHNFSDVLSLVISYWAIRISGREQTLMQTYGYKRAGIFAAFINTAILLVIASILIWEAVSRLVNPEPVTGSIVIMLAALGILLNGLSLLFIKKDSEGNMNIRAAFLHLFADMLTSVAVLAGGLLIWYFGWLWIDGVLTIIIAVWLIYSSWGIFYKAIRIFMQFTPAHINIEEIAREITSINGVRNIHHVHVWQLDEHEVLLEAHLDMEEDCSVSCFEAILQKVEAVLAGFDIHHFNIQPEMHRDDHKELIHTHKPGKAAEH
ncbi:MAG TPA: cation diffusion facilitator family transporter [Bacteroidales bacterium]|nr:cation diffusion facilitator family transporter [Bacteroidales bacterium]